MEEKKLTVQEATELLLMSQSSVYSWIDKGKLKTEDGPTGKLIVISENQIEEIKELNQRSRRNKISKQIQPNSDNLQESSVIDAEFYKNDEEMLTKDNRDLTIYLIEKLQKYAEDSGQLRQLQITHKREMDDLDYWKNECFKLKLDYEKLQESYSGKLLEITALNKQIEELKNKDHSFFGLFKKQK